MQSGLCLRFIVFVNVFQIFLNGTRWCADESVSGGGRRGRPLIFTSARKGEIEQLKWREVDLASGYLNLADSKTGQKAIPLNAGALQILHGQQRIESNDHLFPAHRGKGFYEGTPKVWKNIRTVAGLEDVRLHDLRHSFASIAVSGGASLPIIGALGSRTQRNNAALCSFER